MKQRVCPAFSAGLIAILLFYFSPIESTTANASDNGNGFSIAEQTLFDKRADQALTYLLRNLDKNSFTSGAVIASPSKHEPNYFYHWVRDAALVMNTVLEVYIHTEDPALRTRYRNYLLRWVEFEKSIQDRASPGEPKFYVSGAPYTDPWGRPQNDGPAARAITMIRFAQVLIAEGKIDLVQKLYKAELPATTPIKKDLEFTANYWRDPSFDLWEEVLGQHFYTRMVQRSALLLGARLADQLGDSGAAIYYRQKALELTLAIHSHRNYTKGVMEPTLDRSGGLASKWESLDVAVVLGSLHGSTLAGAYDPLDPWVLASADKLESRFRDMYSINSDTRLGTGIGRYPEDVYDGAGFSGGNPWFISTNSFAELYCRANETLSLTRKLPVTGINQDLIAKLIPGQRPVLAGDTLTGSDTRLTLVNRGLRNLAASYLTRSLYHMDAQGHMSEQFSRFDGFLRGAEDLSWSYASYLTAYMACFKTHTPQPF